MNETPLRAVMVSVDYTDLLQITIPYNRHHFGDFYIVTDFYDFDESAELHKLCNDYNVTLIPSHKFYDNGAKFNKWLALETALDEKIERYGWICFLDADVLWPKGVEIELLNRSETTDELIIRFGEQYTIVRRDELFSPLRRIWNPKPDFPRDNNGGIKIPSEGDWKKWGVHRNVNEWAGYTQIFHADDPHLGSPPWHQTNWIHAGGADSFFQRKWPRGSKKRPPNWEVLHIGSAGANWFGRATEYTDGSKHPQANQRYQQLRECLLERRRRSQFGMGENTKFDHEKLT